MNLATHSFTMTTWSWIILVSFLLPLAWGALNIALLLLESTLSFINGCIKELQNMKPVMNEIKNGMVTEFSTQNRLEIKSKTFSKLDQIFRIQRKS